MAATRLGLTISAVALACLSVAARAAPAGTTDAAEDPLPAAPAAADASECPEIVPRAAWGARNATLVERVPHTPVPFVVVHHTHSPAACSDAEACAAAMRSMQRFHQGKGWNDIGYTFAIGGDGRVYEGRGWGVVGAHAPRYNSRSLGICFIGDYVAEEPPADMVALAHRLIACGVARGAVAEDYVLLGHRQVRDTECPGDALFGLVRSWPHWQPLVDGGAPLANATATTAAPAREPEEANAVRQT